MVDILHSIYGKNFGYTKDGRLMAPGGYVLGSNGSQFGVSAPDRVVLIDDFVGKTIRSEWGVAKGSDAGTANFAINAALDGTVRGVTGAGGGVTMAVNGIRIDSALNWAGNNDALDVQVRVKASAIANLAIFVGFSNQAGMLSMPANGTGGGNGVTLNDVDCVGWLYDSTMTTKDWWLVGNANSVAPTPQDSAGVPTLAVYDVLRVGISKGANTAVFHRNGLQVGVAMPAPVTLATALTPVIAAFSRSAASINIDVDYIHVSQLR